MSFRGVVTLYNLLLPFGLVFALPGFLVKMVRRGNYGRNFGQRFGLYSRETRSRLTDAKPVWVHAVSVGEVFVAIKFIQALKAEDPDQPVLLSCTTSTAHQLAVARENGLYQALYSPLDFPAAVHSALETLNPRMLVLVESELWPNLLHRAHDHGIPVALVNARLSPRSERRYARFRGLTAPLFSQLDLLLAQTPEDIERWSKLGVERDRILCCGSVKYDQPSTETPVEQIKDFEGLLRAIRGDRDGPIVLAGSTHAGEEKLIGKTFLGIREAFPEAFLIIVPRHFERGQEVMRDLRSVGLHPVLKTEFQPEGDCLIANTTGELWAWYHLADVVLIGKSFLSDEGQNPVEPILAGKPVVMGPEMKNFAILVDRLIAADGCARLEGEPSAEGIAALVLDLLRDLARGQELVTNGRRVIEQDQGAARRSAKAVLERLGTLPR